MTKRLALAFLTKDRVALSERTIEPLIHDDIDLWIMDGSKTQAGFEFIDRVIERNHARVRFNITGGADAAIVYALTTLLNETDEELIGVCENDVLLHSDWLGPTLGLFDRGRADGLEVGAVSARAYQDRVLVSRAGYALMHNLGMGHQILTRQAARLALNTYRTHWTTGNVKVFHQLCGLDIRKWWAFRGAQHAITVDWGINAVLAAHGLASLALTPSDVEMIGQDPPLHEQGLAIVKAPVELLRDDDTFHRFGDATLGIREGHFHLPSQTFCRLDDGSQVIFPHQIGTLNGFRGGAWRMKWSQGFGPFAFVAAESEKWPLTVPIAGPCVFFVSGGKTGGKVRIVDTQSGYEIEPDLPPEGDTGHVAQVAVPGNIAYRTVRLTALTPGVCFYGVKVQEEQPVDPTWTFDHSMLPKP